MTTLYIYEIESNDVVAIVNGADGKACLDHVEGLYDTDTHAFTFTPAFGSNDGLNERSDAEIINI